DAAQELVPAVDKDTVDADEGKQGVGEGHVRLGPPRELKLGALAAEVGGRTEPTPSPDGAREPGGAPDAHLHTGAVLRHAQLAVEALVATPPGANGDFLALVLKAQRPGARKADLTGQKRLVR